MDVDASASTWVPSPPYSVLEPRVTRGVDMFSGRVFPNARKEIKFVKIAIFRKK